MNLNLKHHYKTHASYSKFMYIARAITHNRCVSDHKELLALTCGSTTSAL